MTSTTVAVPDQLPPTMTVEEAAQLLGLSRSSAYRAAARGQIPTIRIGARLIVPTAKVLSMLGIQSAGDGGYPVHTAR